MHAGQHACSTLQGSSWKTKGIKNDASMLAMTCMLVLDPGVKRSNCLHECTGGMAGNTTTQQGN